MKILKSWLQDFVEIDDSVEDLAQKLNQSGTEVEDLSGIDPLVVVAKILKITPHPNADRLQIALVTDGKNDYQVVCGAKNIKPGQIVPLAKIGAKIADTLIEKAVIRGVESAGMLCSQAELGLGADHSGIMQLKDDSPLGQPLSQIIESDQVIDVEITPNRGDCLSHLGIAREIAALTKKSTVTKPIQFEKTADQVANNLKVEIIDQKNCYQYFGRVIKNVTVKPSPDWLKERLIKIGQKPINNVVDVTNYILFDLGHPLHAFDAELIYQNKIIVRTAKNNEKITTLDGTVRTLESDALVIADPKKSVAIAGIIGGAETEISSKTTTVILEAAEFNPKSVRKTAKKLNFTTEASYRFERGIDSKAIEYAINKAAKLIAEVGNGIVCSGIVKAGQAAEKQNLKIEYDQINKFLGLKLDSAEINHYLKLLGFEIKDGIATVPSWRHDIENWQDLSEEVGRLYGYDKISPIPLLKSKKPSRSDYFIKEFIKDILVDAGLIEVKNYPFVSQKDLESLKIDSKNILEVTNPLQMENQYLRKSLLPNLLKAVAKNPSFDQILIFELGQVSTRQHESSHLALACAGKNAQGIIESALLSLCDKLKRKLEYKIEELSRDDLVRFKIKKPTTFVTEIDLDKLIKELKIDPDNIKLSKSQKPVHYRKVSRFPSITRDLAFIVNKDENAQQIIEEIYRQSELISRVELFDEFASDKFGANKKNIAFHLDLQDTEKTLTDKEADTVIKKAIKVIELKYNAKIRDY